MKEDRQLKIVTHLPYEIADEGVRLFQRLARHYYIEIPQTVLVLGVIPWKFKPILLLVLILLLSVGQLPSVMRREENVLWKRLRTICLADALVISISTQVILSIPHLEQDIVIWIAIIVGFILLTPVLMISHKMANAFETAFYRTKGYDFRGRKEDVDDW